MVKDKKILYSGMQATGTLTLGNYLGALKNWLNWDQEYECFYGVMDLHSLTVRQEPAEFRKNARNLYALYVAAGLDPKKNCLYYQSHVSAHAELGWILDCFTYMGELNRMTQFKDKAAKHADNINAGLYTYPVLMAADILLYQTDLVPVGVDQSQHIEICRDIANRFNNLHPNTFTIPEGYYPKVGEGAKITSLVDPNSKMSKSDPNPNGYILLMDKPEDIMRKFKRAVTDSDSRIIFDPQNKPGVSNLLQIYALATGKTIEQAAAEFDGKGYGEFKPAVGEAVVELLRPIREKTTDLLNNKDYLEQVYKEGAQKASYLARKTLDKVYRKVGFVAR